LKFSSKFENDRIALCSFFSNTNRLYQNSFLFGAASLLGVPFPNTHFYPTILGAVIFEVGLALLIEIGGQ
jgi:hypothetical protein